MKTNPAHATSLVAATLITALSTSMAHSDDKSPATFWGTETLEAQQLTQQLAVKQGTMGRASHAMIAACHNRSVDIGLAVLKHGGNAVDAFVAVTFADYVQTPGASSMGGPMGAILYNAKGKQTISINAPLKTVHSVTGQWTPGETALGKQVLVPGAVAGLEAMHKRYGHLKWRDLVLPAAHLARDGFTVEPMYAAIVNAYSATIKRSTYGQQTFFHADGTPIKSGEVLHLPQMAITLEAIAAHGSSYMYKGAWSKQAVDAIHAAGGEMDLADFNQYQPEWSAPLHLNYRGQDIYSIAGHDSGGIRLLLALKTLQHTDIKTLGHYSESLDGLETMVRIKRAVDAEPVLYSQTFYDDPHAMQNLLDSNRDAALWDDVNSKTDRMVSSPKGSHSYSVVVVDAAGNAVAGTHTIESLPFGSGIFVQGVPLNNTATLHPFVNGSAYTTPPGNYIIEPLSASLAFKGDQLLLANSTFSASLWPADFELVSSALDFDWSPERIALTPRFGSNALDLTKMTADMSTTVIDKRFNAAVIEQMQQRGIKLSQAGYIDTGMLVMIKRDPATGEMTGFTPEQLADGKAAGY